MGVQYNIEYFRDREKRLTLLVHAGYYATILTRKSDDVFSSVRSHVGQVLIEYVIHI